MVVSEAGTIVMIPRGPTLYDDERMLDHHRHAVAAHRGPVVSVHGDTVIATRDALEFLQLAGREVVSQLLGSAVDGATTRLVRLPNGSTATVRVRLVDQCATYKGMVLEFEFAPSAGSTWPSVLKHDRAVSVAGVSGPWQAVLRLVQASARGCGTVVIEGEQGVGKLAVAEAIHEIGSPGDVLRVFDAAAVDTATRARWVDDLARSLSGPSGTLVLRHVDLLDGLISGRLPALVDDHHERSVRLVVTRTTTVGDGRGDGRDRREGIRGFVIRVPPLRERAADIPLLVAAISSRLGRSHQRWSVAALDVLSRFAWPGNVRQLEGVVGDALLGRPHGDIECRDLPQEVLLDSVPRVLTRMELAEASEIVSALRESAGNKVGAAKALGISRSTLYRKIRSFGFEEQLSAS